MVGYRVPSVQDLFSGKSRFDKKTKETFQKLVMTIFGDKEFKYLSVTEKGIQSVVGFTKESIVVKSIAVPVMNFLANIVELSSFGLSLVDIGRYMLEGFTDLNTHIKNNKRKLKIQSDLLATTNPVKKDKLNKEDYENLCIKIVTSFAKDNWRFSADRFLKQLEIEREL